MDINERVKLIMTDKGLTASEFAERTGIQQSTFSHFINGRNKASLDVVMKIYESFNELNLDWLLYGTGDMYCDKQESSTDSDMRSASGDVVNNSNNIPSQQLLDFSANSPAVMAAVLAQQGHSISPSEPPIPPRQITEIRVFFDDNTFEIFKLNK